MSRALATLWISLATALALAAPLAHAHLDATTTSEAGLCGEHAPLESNAGAEPCQLCVAGGHAAALANAALALPAPAPVATPPSAAPDRSPGAPSRRPGRPRAPPPTA